MAPRLGCAEFKKLQIKKRVRKPSSLSSSDKTTNPMVFPTTVKDETVNADDLGENLNPFAKNINATITSTQDNEKESILHSSSKGFFSEADEVFEKRKPHRSTFIDEEPNCPTSHGATIIERSLKTSVIVESANPLGIVNDRFLKPEYLLDCMRSSSADNLLTYYRYPESKLPHHQKKLIHKVLGQKATSRSSGAKPDESISWYRQFSDNWRKALLSAKETLKSGLISSFYFVQEGLTVLFERDSPKCSLRAYLRLSTMALAEDFKSHGIEYTVLKSKEKVSLVDGDERQFGNALVSKNVPDNAAEDFDVSENEDDDESALLGVGIQLKRAKVRFEKVDVMVEGGIALAELTDYLINQKDRHSFAILPEIYSPGPFIHGTLKRNDVSLTGPCHVGKDRIIHQLKFSGILFPHPLHLLLKELQSAGHQVSLTFEHEPNTDYLTKYPL